MTGKSHAGDAGAALAGIDAGSLTDPRVALRAIFSLLTSLLEPPLKRSLFLLTARLLRQVAALVPTAAVADELVRAAAFPSFVRTVADCSDPFVRDAVLQLLSSHFIS